MIPKGQRRVLALECTCEKLPCTPSSNPYPPPPNHTNYTAILTAARVSICTAPAVGAFPDHFTSLPDTVRKVNDIGPLRDQDLSGFLVVKGKLNLITMDISQALTEMYACAKRLGYGVVQVTNDHRADSL